MTAPGRPWARSLARLRAPHVPQMSPRRCTSRRRPRTEPCRGMLRDSSPPEYRGSAGRPQYAGGLGILAGDQLKDSSDVGVPLIGVGLLYRHGYFTQTLSAEGWQAERYPASDPNGLPLTLLRDGQTEGGEPAGSPRRAPVAPTGGPATAARQVVSQIRPVPLLVLHSHLVENDPRLPH